MVLLVLLVLGGFAAFELTRIVGTSREIATDQVPCLLAITTTEARMEEGLALLYRHLALARKGELENEVRTNLALADKAIAAYDATNPSGDDLKRWTEFKAVRAEYVGHWAPFLKLSNEGKQAEALDLMKSKIEPGFEKADALMADLVDFNEKDLVAANERNLAAGSSGKRWLTLGLLASFVLAGAIALLITRGLNLHLRGIATNLGEGAAQFASASRQVAAASQSLAEGASQQAASLEETSASLEEMTSMVKRSAEATQQARRVAAETLQSAQSGATSNLRLNEALATIRDAAEEMRVAVEGIKASSGNVAKIIKTIDEIAFQTNILALNAAVEAARAGEAGMGFAVVADEVRNLAQRSAQSARETAGLIAAAVEQSERGVAVNERVVGAVHTVTGAASDVAKSLEEIVTRVRQVEGQVSEIASACTEQAQGISQVNTAVASMDKVTQSSAAGAEETASASEQLNAQALAVEDQVRTLLRLVGASASGGGDAPAATDTPGIARSTVPGAGSSSTPHSGEAAPTPSPKALEGFEVRDSAKTSVSSLDPKQF